MDCDSAGKIAKNKTKLKIAENKNTRNSRKDCFKKNIFTKIGSACYKCKPSKTYSTLMQNTAPILQDDYGLEKYEIFLINWLDLKKTMRYSLKKAKLSLKHASIASHLVYMDVFQAKYPHWKNLMKAIDPEKKKKDITELYKGVKFLKMWFDSDKSYNEAIVASRTSTALCNFMEDLVEKGVFDECCPDWKSKHYLLKQIEKDNPIFVEGESSYKIHST